MDTRLGIWLINLDRDPERLRDMTVQLDRMGLSYKRFPGIYGRDHEAELLKRADTEAYSRNMGKPIIPGKMGLYASHLKVWEDFLASDKEFALILEDDVVFHEDFPACLDLAIGAADHWDTVRFNCVRAKMPVRQGYVGHYRLNAYIGPFTGNATYLIKRDVARQILPGLWPQQRALDHELNRFFVHDFRQFGLEPFASHVRPDIESTVFKQSAVQAKRKRSQRLPYYRQKALNYVRRLLWLARNARIIPSNRQLGKSGS